MAPGESAGTATIDFARSRSVAALPAAATTTEPLLVTKLRTLLNADQIAAPPPPWIFRGIPAPSDIEITSAPCAFASRMPCSTHDTRPEAVRKRQRLNGVSGTH